MTELGIREADAPLDAPEAEAGPHLSLVIPEAIPPGLSSVEIAVLGSISLGNTAVQVARGLDITKAEVQESRYSLMAKFATRSIALATDQAIRRGIIAVEVAPEPEVIEGLTRADHQMLRLYAKGITNHRIARESGAKLKTIETYHDRFLERIGAWSRPHAIRRGHELGVLS